MYKGALSAVLALACLYPPLRADFELEWVRRYDGYRGRDVVDAAAVGDTGTVYVAGRMGGRYGLVSYSSEGDEQWRLHFDRPGLHFLSWHAEVHTDVAVGAGGALFVGRPTDAGFAVSHLASDGTQLWTRAWNIPESQEATGVRLAAGGNGATYVACGMTTMNWFDEAPPPGGVSIVALDPDGKETWNIIVDPTEEGDQAQGYVVEDLEVSSGGAISLALTEWYDDIEAGPVAGLVVRLSSEGDVRWWRDLDTSLARSLDALDDGSVAVAGGGLAVRLDAAGDELWRRELNSVDVVGAHDGTYVLEWGTTGHTLWKLDLAGEPLWWREFGELVSQWWVRPAGNLLLARDGALYAAAGDGKDVVVARFGPDGNDGTSFHIRGEATDMILSALNETTRGDLIVSATESDTNFALGRSDFLTARVTPAGEVVWADRLDDRGGSDRAVAVAVDGRDGVYVSGLSSDGFVTVKYDGDGTQLWETAVPMSGYISPETNWLSDLHSDLTQDGYLWVRVYLDDPVTDAPRVFTARFDSEGNTLATFEEPARLRWSPLGRPPDPEDFALDAQGNLYAGATTEDGFFITRYDSQGSQAWAGPVEIPPSTLSEPSRGPLVVGADGSLYAALDAFGTSADVLVTAFSPEGVQLWQQSVDYAADSAVAVGLDRDGNVYAVGQAQRFGRQPFVVDVFVRKYSAAGELLWDRVLGTPTRDVPVTARVAADGTVVVMGTRTESEGGDSYLTVQFSPAGDVEWERVHGGFRLQGPADLALDGEGHVYVTGISSPDPDNTTTGWVVLKYSRRGDLLALQRYVDPLVPAHSLHHQPSALAVGADGSVYVTAGRWASDYVTVKYSQTMPRFVRGDAHADSSLDIADATFTLSYLFASGSSPTCLEAADVNDSGNVDVADAVYFLSFLFNRGPPPEAPFPDCGADPTFDELTCESHAPCETP